MHSLHNLRTSLSTQRNSPPAWASTPTLVRPPLLQLSPEFLAGIGGWSLGPLLPRPTEYWAAQSPDPTSPWFLHTPGHVCLGVAQPLPSMGCQPPLVMPTTCGVSKAQSCALPTLLIPSEDGPPSLVRTAPHPRGAQPPIPSVDGFVDLTGPSMNLHGKYKTHPLVPAPPSEGQDRWVSVPTPPLYLFLLPWGPTKAMRRGGKGNSPHWLLS